MEWALPCRSTLTPSCRAGRYLAALRVRLSGGVSLWYGHDPERYDEFARRYRTELDDPERTAALAHLRELAAHGPLTLLTAAKRSDISEATVLAALLTNSATR